jgi:hypothetical protein
VVVEAASEENAKVLAMVHFLRYADEEAVVNKVERIA